MNEDNNRNCTACVIIQFKIHNIKTFFKNNLLVTQPESTLQDGFSHTTRTRGRQKKMKFSR